MPILISYKIGIHSVTDLVKCSDIDNAIQLCVWYCFQTIYEFVKFWPTIVMEGIESITFYYHDYAGNPIKQNYLKVYM